MARFSRKYASFEEWLNVEYAKLVKNKSYFTRIVRYLVHHPAANLDEARGHRPKEAAEEKPAEFIEEFAKVKAEELKKILTVTYRTGVTMKNIVIHDEYYGCLLQAFADHPEDLPGRRELEDFMMKLLEKWVGYPESEFWFMEIAFMGYEPPIEMYLAQCPGWEFRVEKKGRIVYERTMMREDVT